MSLIKEGNQLFKEANQKKYIMIYGDSDFDMRANVITLNILQYGKIVHHNFASLIFADIFGIQLRSGCFCAGPFGMKLLKLDEKKVQMIEEEVSVGIFRSKPGYMRLDLAFYL
jgi:selenocysteine lyase/cysteine desulfurase